MITHEERLKAVSVLLGLDGWYIIEDEIILTDNNLTIPTEEELLVFIENENLATAKEDKKASYSMDKFIEINGAIYSTKREDILKYKEATDISEDMGLADVKLNTAFTIEVLPIVDARAIIKTLSEKALNDYWSEVEYMALVDNKTTIAQLDEIQ